MNLTKKLCGVVFCLALNACLLAQLASLPPSSVFDGVLPRSIGANAGVNHWNDPAVLGRFGMAGDGTAPLPGLNTVFGLGIPAGLLAEKSRIATKGGSIRAIFLGESAGWLNSFGYSYNGNPASADSFSVFTHIQACPKTPYPVNVHFGDTVDLPVAAGSAEDLDFWLNAAGGSGWVDPARAGGHGGVYTVFNPGGSLPNTTPGNVAYLQEPLMVSTWIPSLSSYRAIATYIVGFEDSRADHRIDSDYSDLLIGFQFFLPTAVHFDGVVPSEASPVPEPASYPWIAAIGMLGLIVQRGLAAVRRRRTL